MEAPGLTAEVAEEVGAAEKTAVGTELVEGKFGLLEVAERTADYTELTAELAEGLSQG